MFLWTISLKQQRTSITLLYSLYPFISSPLLISIYLIRGPKSIHTFKDHQFSLPFLDSPQLFAQLYLATETCGVTLLSVEYFGCQLSIEIGC